MNLLLSIAYTSITIAQFSHGFYAVFTLFCFSLSLSLVRILFLHRKIQLLILLQFYFLFSSYFFLSCLVHRIYFMSDFCFFSFIFFFTSLSCGTLTYIFILTIYLLQENLMQGSDKDEFFFFFFGRTKLGTNRKCVEIMRLP